MDALYSVEPPATAVAPDEAGDGSSDDEVAVDIDEYDQQVQEADPATVVPSKPQEPVSKGAVTSCPSAVLQTRRYDLNITYDKYYQTPRYVCCCCCCCCCCC